MMSICRKNGDVITLVTYLPPSTTTLPKGHSATGLIAGTCISRFTSSTASTAAPPAKEGSALLGERGAGDGLHPKPAVASACKHRAGPGKGIEWPGGLMGEKTWSLGSDPVSLRSLKKSLRFCLVIYARGRQTSWLAEQSAKIPCGSQPYGCTVPSWVGSWVPKGHRQQQCPPGDRAGHHLTP